MRDLFFVSAWVVLLPLAFQGAQLGVLLWTWTSLLAPNDVLYGIGQSPPYAKVSALLTLGLMLAGRGGGIRFRWSATVILMICLALGSLASQATALAADSAQGWDLYQKFAKILALAVVVTAVMRDRLRLHALLLAICLGMGFTGLGEAAKFLISGGGHKVLGSASTGDNNQIALDVLMTMPMGYYLHQTAARGVARLTCLGYIGMSAVCVIATASRAAFVGLALLGLTFVLASKRKVFGLVLMAAVAAVGSQLVSAEWVDRMNTIKSADDDDSFMGRVGAWKVSTVVALERPIFGGGFHAIQNLDVWYPRAAAASAITILPREVPPGNPKAAHSIYFEVLGDQGFLGLGLFLALFLTGFRNAGIARRLARRSGRADLAWAASLAGALRVSIIVFLVNGAFLSAVYYDIDYLIVAMIAVLRDLVERSLREPAPATASPQVRIPASVG